MLKKTTIMLGLSVLGASFISVILSLIIVMTLGGIGSKSVTSSSSTSASGSSKISSSSALSKQSGTMSSSLSSSTSSSASVYSEGGLVSHTAGKVFLGILCILVYIGIVYSSAWHEGSKDPNRVKYGHMNKFMAKGFVAGLLASIPYAALTTTYIVSHAALAKSTAAIIIETIYRMINIQYIVFGDGFLAFPISCFLLLLVLPAISEAGYVAGYHQFTMMSKILYKNPKNRNGTYRKGISNLKK